MRVALKKYISNNGRTWKSKLRHAWERAETEGALQQLRNTLGPSWLDKVSTEKLLNCVSEERPVQSLCAEK